jgi:hypothetical protein
MDKELKVIMEAVQLAQQQVTEVRNQVAAEEKREVLVDVELGLEWVMNKLEKLQAKHA